MLSEAEKTRRALTQIREMAIVLQLLAANESVDPDRKVVDLMFQMLLAQVEVARRVVEQGSRNVMKDGGP